MSRREPKAAEWLRQQIEELGALRNASVRDPQFKAWRQNTLTFIQRIWPDDPSRSERFRRVPFSPPSTRADARTAREQFERGCGEALELLNAFRVALGEERVAPGTTRAVPRADDSFEGDFPTVELGAEAAPEVSPARDESAPETPILDLPPSHEEPAAPRSSGPTRLPQDAFRPVVPEGLPEDYAGATPLDGAPGAGPAEPAPSAPRGPEAETPPSRRARPETRVSIRGPAGAERAEPKVNPLKDILASHRKDAAPAPRSGKNGRGKKGGKARLKDMLGLASLEQAAHDDAPGAAPATLTPGPAGAGEAAAPPPSVPASAGTPGSAAPPPGAAAPPVDPPPPHAEPPHSDHWTLPEFLVPVEALPHPAPHATGQGTARDATMDGAPEAPGETSPPDPDVEPAAATSPDGPGEGPEPDDAASMTADFLRNSPVLSSTPRPVTRRAASPREPAHTEPIPARDSAAGRLLALAARVDALGVPEGHRARARATLTDLARQVEEPEIAWEALREGVTVIMEFPPVARRALPLLIPFLDAAA